METLTDIVVAVEDIDSYDHANCRKYLKYYQAGQEELLERLIGVSYKGLEEQHQMRAVIRHSDVEYLQELFAGDRVVVYTSIERLGNSSMTYLQYIEKEGIVVSKARVTAVFTNLEKKPIRIPDHIRNKLDPTSS